MKDSDEIITEPEEVKACWTDYVSNLVNADTVITDRLRRATDDKLGLGRMVSEKE